MDPVLAATDRRSYAERMSLRKGKDREIRIQRRRSRFETWAWTEVPAYRLALLLGYSFAMYFGISSLIAGVPAFENTSPNWWTIVWAIVIILCGPVGIFGILHESLRFYKIELVSAAALALCMTSYSGSVLFLAYGAGDPARAAAGSGFAWLTSGLVIRMLWLVGKVSKLSKLSKSAKKS
jgi:hypothetical protein